jgi:tetratricopeptide (TPR) repeat protein
MIYLYIEIYSYKQLLKIAENLISRINNRFAKLAEERGIDVLYNRNGVMLFGFGNAEHDETENTLNSVYLLFSVLEALKGRLHGFNLYVAVQPEEIQPEIEALLHKYQHVLFGIQTEEGLWIHKSLRTLFKKTRVLAESGNYINITVSRHAVATEKYISQIQKIKKADFLKLLRAFSRIKTKSPKCNTALIYSHQRILARSITENVLKKYAGSGVFASIPVISLTGAPPCRLYPLVKSVNIEFMNRVDHYPAPGTGHSWEHKKQFLLDLLNEKNTMADQPDRDIFYAFSCYLEAYCAMMKAKSLPGIIVCDAIEAAHPEFNTYFSTMILDLSQRYSLLLLFISTKKEPPSGWGSLKIKKTEIAPLSAEEVKTCMGTLYSKLRFPSHVSKQIQRLSGGDYNSVLHYIYYLRRHEKIRWASDRYVWVSHAEQPLRIPVKPLHCTWLFITALKEEEKIVLYILMLTHRVFSFSMLSDFFESVDYKEKVFRKYLSYLKNTGLVEYTDQNRPTTLQFIGLTKKNLGNQGRYYERKLGEYIGRHLPSFLPYRATALLKLLQRLNNYSVLADVITYMLQYSMDTHSFSRARFFLNLPAALVKQKIQLPNRETLEIICNTYYVRYLLLQGKAKEAQKLVDSKLSGVSLSFTANPVNSNLHLQLSGYFLTQNDTDKAVKEAKKAALSFQELSLTEKRSEAYLSLGQALLSKGSVYEALEYFEFTRKFSADIHSALLQAQAYLFKSIALFFIGNYTQAMQNATSGIELCETHGLRRVEHLLIFINARMNFDLGLYREARTILEQGLMQARLYSLEESTSVLKAWIARTHCYCGEYAVCETLLNSLPQTRETVFFRAEIFLLQSKYEQALTLLEEASGIKEKQPFLFAEKFSWKSGFALLEDRRLDLLQNGTALGRRLKNFKAYAGCFTGRLGEGLNELHTVTIREKIPSYEPYAHLYFFLYYLILKNCPVKKDPDSEIADGLTVLNLALKHLQERSTAIDEPRHRIHYLSNNYWNKLLFHEAKQNKLL